MTKRIPGGLQVVGKRFWRQATSERTFEEAHDLTRLFLACRCLDELDADERRVRADGRYIEDRFHQLREHPACKAIRDNKMLFIKIIRELALDITAPDDRPPRQY